MPSAWTSSISSSARSRGLTKQGDAVPQTQGSNRGPPEGFAPQNGLEGVGSVGPLLYLSGHGFQAGRVDPSGALRLLGEVLEQPQLGLGPLLGGHSRVAVSAADVARGGDRHLRAGETRLQQQGALVPSVLQARAVAGHDLLQERAELL